MLTVSCVLICTGINTQTISSWPFLVQQSRQIEHNAEEPVTPATAEKPPKRKKPAAKEPTEMPTAAEKSANSAAKNKQRNHDILIKEL